MKRFNRYFGQVVAIALVFAISLGLFGCGGSARNESARPPAAPSMKQAAPPVPAGGTLDVKQPAANR